MLYTEGPNSYDAFVRTTHTKPPMTRNRGERGGCRGRLQNGYLSPSTFTRKAVMREPSALAVLLQNSLTRSNSPLLSKLFTLASCGCKKRQFFPIAACLV